LYDATSGVSVVLELRFFRVGVADDPAAGGVDTRAEADADTGAGVADEAGCSKAEAEAEAGCSKAGSGHQSELGAASCRVGKLVPAVSLSNSNGSSRVKCCRCSNEVAESLLLPEVCSCSESDPVDASAASGSGIAHIELSPGKCSSSHMNASKSASVSERSMATRI
jgi:hypothetical protein